MRWSDFMWCYHLINFITWLIAITSACGMKLKESRSSPLESSSTNLIHLQLYIPPELRDLSPKALSHYLYFNARHTWPCGTLIFMQFQQIFCKLGSSIEFKLMVGVWHVLRVVYKVFVRNVFFFYSLSCTSSIIRMTSGAEAVVVAECLQRTLEPNAQIRRNAENQLKQMEQLPGKLHISNQ